MAGPRHARVREGEARLNLEAVCKLQAKGYGWDARDVVNLAVIH